MSGSVIKTFADKRLLASNLGISFFPSYCLSLSFCRGSRVEGSMSRARVPCRGLRVTFLFSKIFFFFEKVITDAINDIKTNKKNLKSKWRVNIF